MLNSLYLLYRTGFAATSGTSVYVRRLLRGHENRVVHLMWDISESGAKSLEQVVVVDDASAWRWPLPRGGRYYAWLRKRCRLNWWDGHVLNENKLKRRLRLFSQRPARAWVICMYEWDAIRACAIWDALGRPPFILHVVDIFHDGLSEDETPVFRHLVREAQHVICGSENIAFEMRNNGAKSVSLLQCCSDFSADGRQPLTSPLRVIVAGALWNHIYPDNPAIRFLVAAWPQIKRRFPAVELHYSGAWGKQLPEELHGEILDHGLLSYEAYQDLLRGCHLAYLPVSHPSHTVARFSVPSRLADYLACGLPVIASADAGTGIFSFLNSLPQGCVANVADAKALVQAVVAFAGDSACWAEASAKAASYARQQLRVENVREELFCQLERTE